MTTVYINNRAVTVQPQEVIGQGGEADIFRLDATTALKLFKQPDHPDFVGQKALQQGAEDRLHEHQQKLPDFPSSLPAAVVAPQALAMDRRGRRIVGYTMPLVDHADTLLRYTERQFRRAAAIDNNAMVAVLRDLYRTISALHQRGVVIGDFNSLNVLVRDGNHWLIDADSFQYDRYDCRLYTCRYVDPLRCDVHGQELVPTKRATPDSDWYAFAAMVMECLLYVGPYGGVYRPAKGEQTISPGLRPQHRVTVFHPNVRYPKPAVPLNRLPQELLTYLERVFVGDCRGPFPVELLNQLHWQFCTQCGTEHACAACPECQFGQAPPMVIVAGQVRCETVFTTKGTMLTANLTGGDVLRWLYHDTGAVRWDNGTVLVNGAPQASMRFSVMARHALIAQGQQLMMIDQHDNRELIAVDRCGAEPAFACNGQQRIWIHRGQLWRDGDWGQEFVGDVLRDQTRIWLGDKHGFGFYRAGQLHVAFIFDGRRRGINDTVAIPAIPGQLIDVQCHLRGEHVWLFYRFSHGPKHIDRCVLLNVNGTTVAVAETEANDEHWLAPANGKQALGPALLAATGDGLTRIESQNGGLHPVKVFAGTETFIKPSDRLSGGRHGLYVIGDQTISLLRQN